MIMETKETCAFIIIQIQKWFKKSIMAWVTKQKLETKWWQQRPKKSTTQLLVNDRQFLHSPGTALDSHRGGGPHIPYMRTWSSASGLFKCFSVNNNKD